MTTIPTISVVIPAYNEAATIAGTLRSLQHQTVQPLEVIVVDNNSTDETAAIAESFSFVRVVKETQQGIAYARNAGFDAARGDVVARIDADTLASKRWLETIQTHFSTHPSTDGLAGALSPREFSWLGARLMSLGFTWFRHWHQRSIGVRPMMYGCNLALRRSAWHGIRDQTHPNDPRMTEDIEVTVLLQKNNHRIDFNPRMIVSTHLLGVLSREQMQRYYRNDNYTLGFYRVGNKKRWASDVAPPR